ncbi:hypothetical protein Patl1_20774 [Pistacia atlantica]|uniref:Uncharacterized protein n=1 Tax=Pistacia atlantica TaxID=434234 RepID=A0ACC1BN56_9ROSI|nr:hypothetical protein Patl1_20774 [Pistacia atlantica]
METPHRDCNRRLCRILLLLCLTMAALLFTQCDARRSMGLTRKDRKHSRSSIIKSSKKLRVIKHDGDPSSNTGPYGVSSPFSLPPFDSLSPYPLPENAPPYCIYPPFSPQVPQGPPSATLPSPVGYTPTTPYIPPILPIQSPPPSPTGSEPSPSGPFPTPSPPESSVPSPPEALPSPYIYVPSPPGSVLSPPFYEPSPPSGSTPSPPSSVPSPTGFVPSPPVFLPPIVYPPPIVPPSPKKSPNIALWCVAKPSVPDPIIQEAMNYACGSGADCDTIESSGPCFEPNTVYAHASYAFNSYWQRNKVAGGTCSFGGTAMLVTVDPSHDGCHFDFY